MYKVHFPVINIDWQKSPVPATDLAEIVFLKFQFLPIESIRLSGPPGPEGLPASLFKRYNI